MKGIWENHRIKAKISPIARISRKQPLFPSLPVCFKFIESETGAIGWGLKVPVLESDRPELDSQHHHRLLTV